MKFVSNDGLITEKSEMGTLYFRDSSDGTYVEDQPTIDIITYLYNNAYCSVSYNDGTQEGTSETVLPSLTFTPMNESGNVDTITLNVPYLDTNGHILNRFIDKEIVVEIFHIDRPTALTSLIQAQIPDMALIDDVEIDDPDNPPSYYMDLYMLVGEDPTIASNWYQVHTDNPFFKTIHTYSLDVTTHANIQELQVTGSTTSDGKIIGNAGLEVTSGDTILKDATVDSLTFTDSDLISKVLVTDEYGQVTTDSSLDLSELHALDGITGNIQSQIDSEISARQSADTDLDTAINAEVSARLSADSTLQNNIDSEASTRADADTTLQNNIDSEASTRADADTALQSNISAEQSRAEGVESQLNSDISNEASARQSADADLQTSINTEISDRESADLSILTQVDTKRDKIVDVHNGPVAYTQEANKTESLYDIIDTGTDGGSLVARTSGGTIRAERPDDNKDVANKLYVDSADNTLQSNIDAEATARQNAISSEASARSSADTTLQNNIDAEASTRSSADTTLQNNIDAEASTRASADTTLQDNIDSEASARSSADSTLDGKITQEISDRESAITNEATARSSADSTLQDNIDAEVSARASADTTLNGKITQEITDRQAAVSGEATARASADSTLQANITAEETARASADTTLQNNIDAEASARSSADTTLQGNITAEATARSSADTTLQSNIDQKVAKTFSTSVFTGTSNNTVTASGVTLNFTTKDTNNNNAGIISLSLPVATDSVAGVATAAQIAQIEQNRQDIELLSGKSSRYAVNVNLSNKTDPQIQSALTDAWRNASGQTTGDPAQYTTLVNLWNNHEYTWLTVGSTTSWVDRGISTVSIATDQSLGVVLGTAQTSGNEGNIYVDSDGSMAVIGWDDVKTDISNAQSDISSLQTGKLSSVNQTSTAGYVSNIAIDGTDHTKLNVTRTALPSISIAGTNAGTVESGKYVSAITSSGHTVTVSKSNLPALTVATATGNGNAITSLSVSDHTITPNKGTTFLTQHQDISGKLNTNCDNATIDVSGGNAGRVGQALIVGSGGTITYGEAPGKVDDVKVDGTSVVSNKIANITLPVVNNGTFNVLSDNTTVQSFTANATGTTNLKFITGTGISLTPNTTNKTITIASTVTGNVQSDWNATTGLAVILNKPTLATVATSGSYNDLSNKPTIPTVNNATLTIQKNGTTVKTFTANASSNVTANITVPTAVSELTNDAGYVTSLGFDDLTSHPTTLSGYGITDAVSNVSYNSTSKKIQKTINGTTSDVVTLSTVATSGSYNDLSNKPTIPTVNNGTLNLKVGDTVAQSFTANATGTTNIAFEGSGSTTVTGDSTNKKITISTPTLATVATSGSYNDLSNKPTIPTVNNATFAIQGNGTTASSFTANASSNVTLNIKGSGGTTVTKSANNEITISTGTIPTIPSISVASSGTGNVISDVTASNHALTLVKSETLSATQTGGISKTYELQATGYKIALQLDKDTYWTTNCAQAYAKVLVEYSRVPFGSLATLDARKGIWMVKINYSGNDQAIVVESVGDSVGTGDGTLRYFRSYVPKNNSYGPQIGFALENANIKVYIRVTLMAGTPGWSMLSTLGSDPGTTNYNVWTPELGRYNYFWSSNKINANITGSCDGIAGSTWDSLRNDRYMFGESAIAGSIMAMASDGRMYKLRNGANKVFTLPLHCGRCTGTFTYNDSVSPPTLTNYAQIMWNMRSQGYSELTNASMQGSAFTVPTLTAGQYGLPLYVTGSLSNGGFVPDGNIVTAMVNSKTNIQIGRIDRANTASNAVPSLFTITGYAQTAYTLDANGKLTHIDGKEINDSAVAWGDITGKPTFATVATSGSYNDLSNKPTIPTVYDKTLTIKSGSTNAIQFTANSSSDKTLTVSGSGGTTVTASSNTLTISSTAVNDKKLTIKGGTTTAVEFTANSSSDKTLTISGSGTTTVTGSSNAITISSADQYTGTVTQVKVGTTAYDPTDGVISLPAYPTVPTVNNGTLTIKGGTTTATTFTANSSTSPTLTISGSGGTTVTGASGSITISSTSVGSANLNIQGSGTTATSFSANASSAVTLNIKGSGGTTVTKTATNEITVESATLATVATSGSYNDLSNKPTIPTVNNGTLNIQGDANTVGSFTANATGTTNINFASGTGVSIARDTTNKKLTINAMAITGSASNTTLPTATSVTMYSGTILSQAGVWFIETYLSGNYGFQRATSLADASNVAVRTRNNSATWGDWTYSYAVWKP